MRKYPYQFYKKIIKGEKQCLIGQVFSNQLFESHIFALFVNSFLSGGNGIAQGYKNSMAITHSGSDLTIDTGAIVIQGRYLEEDTGTTINAGTDSLFCKLVIEIDLDKINTQNDFRQGYYKIITDSSNYPALTQNDIVNDVSGVYQYELARFKTNSSGITDFVDKRTFIGNGILDAMHPIGSIHISVNPTNPSQYFGGTWIAWGSGKVPVGIDTSDPDFDTVEETGGEKTHTLTVSEMPKHDHAQSQTAKHYIDPESSGNIVVNTGGTIRGRNCQFAEKGGDQPHNNLQPYITCYMWKRTA